MPLFVNNNHKVIMNSAHFACLLACLLAFLFVYVDFLCVPSLPYPYYFSFFFKPHWINVWVFAKLPRVYINGLIFVLKPSAYCLDDYYWSVQSNFFVVTPPNRMSSAMRSGHVEKSFPNSDISNYRTRIRMRMRHKQVAWVRMKSKTANNSIVSSI